MIRKLSLLIAAGAMLMAAQTVAPGRADVLIYPPPVQSFEPVKGYLGLSDAQIEQLRQILFEKDKGAQDVYVQIREKQQAVNELLETGAHDPLRIGALNIEIYNLSKQTVVSDAPYRQRALAVLTDQQRAKLASLDQILKQSPAANQAVTLLLLEPLPPSPPTILNRPLLETSVAPFKP